MVIRHRWLSGIANSAPGTIQQLKIRAAQGDAAAQQAYAQLEAELQSHFGAQVGSLESEVWQRLAKIPWLPAALGPAAALPPPPATTTTSSNSASAAAAARSSRPCI